MGIKSLVANTTLLFSLLGISASVLADNNVITVKAGTYTIDDTFQLINGLGFSSVTFEEDGSTIGIEYDRMLTEHVSIGGGYQTYSLAYTSGIGPGEVDVSFGTFNAKYHFTTGNFKPFIGGSAGIVLTDFTGNITGNSVGLALGIMAGFRWQFSAVGLYAEYKVFVSANSEDSAGAEVDLAGDSVTAGLSIAF